MSHIPATFEEDCLQFCQEPYRTWNSFVPHGTRIAPALQALLDNSPAPATIGNEGVRVVESSEVFDFRGLQLGSPERKAKQLICFYDGLHIFNRSRRDVIGCTSKRNISHAASQDKTEAGTEVDGIWLANEALEELRKGERGHPPTAAFAKSLGPGCLANSSKDSGRPPNCKLDFLPLFENGPPVAVLVATRDIAVGEDLLWKYPPKMSNCDECGRVERGKAHNRQLFCKEHIWRPCAICKWTEDNVRLFCHRCGFSKPGGWFEAGQPPLEVELEASAGNQYPTRARVERMTDTALGSDPTRAAQVLGLSVYPKYLQVGGKDCLKHLQDAHVENILLLGQTAWHMCCLANAIDEAELTQALFSRGRISLLLTFTIFLSTCWA